MTCDIGVGPVAISAGALRCNNTDQNYIDQVFVTGSSQLNPVTMADSQVTIVFQDINMKTESSITISGSSATIVTLRLNSIASTASGDAAIGCSLNSNITIQASG
jgi:hypothetical protein